jgi:hypothetical protein
MGMKSGDQADTGGDWRVQLQDMRTWAVLRADTPAADAAERLSDRALKAAAQNPDHSEAGRAAAAQAARARNVSVTPWRLRVPGFVAPADLAKGDRLFFGWGRRVRVWSGATIYLSLLGVFGAVVVQQLTLESHTRGELDPVEAFGRANAAMSVGYGFAYAFGAAILVWFFATIFRRKPARVLLLRKFNVRALSEPVERMLAHELRPYGHVAALSDKFIRRDRWGWVQGAILSIGNPLAFLWFVVGMPIRLVWRLFDRSAMGPAVVLNARDYRNLARRLRDRLGLNAQVALVSKEAFLVRTSDAWWQMVARLLMDSSDVIVVDLSQVTEGTAWELDAIQQEDALGRCVFVAIWGKLEAAGASLRARGIDAPIHAYAPDGEMQRRAPFRAAMLGAMRATHGVA